MIPEVMKQCLARRAFPRRVPAASPSRQNTPSKIGCGLTTRRVFVLIPFSIARTIGA